MASTSPLSISATGALVQDGVIASLANDLANAQTHGYKRYQPIIQDLIYQDKAGVGTGADQVNPVGLQMGSGAQLSGSVRVMQQGDPIPTGNPLDLSIQGIGYFQIQLPDGTVGYTRSGTFIRSAEGILVTPEGNPLIPEIALPINILDVQIDKEGRVFVTNADAPEAKQEVGQIQIATFMNPPGLRAIGRNLDRESPASGEAVIGNPNEDGLGYIQAGFLEGSNVNTVVAVTDLVKAQQAYEMNIKVMKTSEQMSQELKQVRA